jgi:actin-like ATPase involved in cell morphogenesis
MQNSEWSLSKAVELVVENIKSTTEWTTPEQVIDFIEKFCDYLNGGKPN